MTSNMPLPWHADVLADPNGGIWLATYAGLVRYDGTTTTYDQANTRMPGTVVCDVARGASTLSN
jgi:ligand-binding sensor domain-containing protein